MCEVGDVVERYLLLSRVRAAGAVQSCTNEAVLAQACHGTTRMRRREGVIVSA